MAQKKKPESKSPTAGHSAAPPRAAKPAKPSSGDQHIDTNAAANAAAAMVGGKVPLPSTGGAKKESAAFKQLKAGLNKPSAGALGGVFGNTAQQKKSQVTHGGGKQIGRNQTFGADATRSGVPRRTPG